MAAVGAQDLPVVTGIAVLYVVANVLVDVVYTIIDPRLKTS